MKKIFVTIVVACLALSAWAVELPKQGFGVQVGWAQPILRLNDSANPSTAKDSLSNVVKMKGFKVGVVYDGSFIAGFGTSIGLNYTFGAYNSGWKKDRNNYYGMPYPRNRQIITYHQLELYVDWQYKFEIAKETYLILYTGPTIQCGLGFEMRDDYQTYEGENYVPRYFNGYDAADADQTFRRFNVTWGLGAGFQYQRYFLRGGYDFGIVNPYKHTDFTNGNHTRGRLDQWEIKLGMYLWYTD